MIQLCLDKICISYGLSEPLASCLGFRLFSLFVGVEPLSESLQMVVILLSFSLHLFRDLLGKEKE